MKKYSLAIIEDTDPDKMITEEMMTKMVIIELPNQRELKRTVIRLTNPSNIRDSTENAIIVGRRATLQKIVGPRRKQQRAMQLPQMQNGRATMAGMLKRLSTWK